MTQVGAEVLWTSDVASSPIIMGGKGVARRGKDALGKAFAEHVEGFPHAAHADDEEVKRQGQRGELQPKLSGFRKR